jgi:hypothetical protein
MSAACCLMTFHTRGDARMDGTSQARSLIDSTCGVLSLSQWYRPLLENAHCTDPFDTEDREPQQDKVAIRTAALSSSTAVRGTKSREWGVPSDSVRSNKGLILQGFSRSNSRRHESVSYITLAFIHCTTSSPHSSPSPEPKAQLGLM